MHKYFFSLQPFRGPNHHDILEGLSGFEQFIALFRIHIVADNLIDHLFDLQALQSLQNMALNLRFSGDLTTWNINAVMRKLETKISNCTMTTWLIINRHFISNLYQEPCHFCSMLGGWNDIHVSTHLGPEDMGPNGPRLNFLDRHICPHCLGNVIHYPQVFQLPGFY